MPEGQGYRIVDARVRVKKALIAPSRQWPQFNFDIQEKTNHCITQLEGLRTLGMSLISFRNDTGFQLSLIQLYWDLHKLLGSQF